MDYEKAYNETLERAKAVYKKTRTDTAKGHLEEIFPELADSENERIRKGLVYHLQELREWKVGEMVPIKTPEHYDAWIAYLEKQKEQKTEPFSCGHENGSSEKPNNQWSEEDEMMLENVFGTYKTLEDMLDLSTGQDRDTLDYMNFERDWLKNKFKSLRPKPHWKPSEEQMMAFHELLGKVPRTPELYELYDDLEKLM